jgi:hypothetical protein
MMSRFVRTTFLPALAAPLLALASSISPAAAAAAPCTAPEYRAMDFAIGTWQAKDAKGKILGTGVWQSILGGCVMRFTWAGHHYNGTANDAYDATRGLWQKAWVSDHGKVELGVGHPLPHHVIYEGYDYKDGRRVQMHREHLVLLGDGRLRYHMDMSLDDGHTWKPAGGDTFYTKLKS